MNILAAKLHMIANPPPPVDGDGDSEVKPENEETSDGEQPQEIPDETGKEGQVNDD